MEAIYGQTLALRLGNRDEHCTLESDMTGLNVKGNLYIYLGPTASVHSEIKPGFGVHVCNSTVTSHCKTPASTLEAFKKPLDHLLPDPL